MYFCFFQFEETRPEDVLPDNYQVSNQFVLSLNLFASDRGILSLYVVHCLVHSWRLGTCHRHQVKRSAVPESGHCGLEKSLCSLWFFQRSMYTWSHGCQWQGWRHQIIPRTWMDQWSRWLSWEAITCKLFVFLCRIAVQMWHFFAPSAFSVRNQWLCHLYVLALFWSEWCRLGRGGRRWLEGRPQEIVKVPKENLRKGQRHRITVLRAGVVGMQTRSHNYNLWERKLSIHKRIYFCTGSTNILPEHFTFAVERNNGNGMHLFLASLCGELWWYSTRY